MGLAAVMFGVAGQRLAAADCRRRPLVSLLGGLRRRRAERAAHRAARHPAAHRHARHVLAVPRHRRRASRTARSTTPGFPAAFLALGQGYLWGVIPAQLPIFAGGLRRLRRAAAPFGRSAARCTRSASAPAGARYAGIPVARRVGLVYVLSGLVVERRRDRLRRASRTGAIGRRHRLRARRDHRRRARRHVGVRRPRHALRHAARPVRAGGAAERPAPRGAAVGAGRRADRRAAARDHCASIACARAERARSRDAASTEDDRREEQSGRRALRARSSPAR